uniref:Uncharacterized protein n=1 Tax=Magallana gigas TaxID=29159 RepID=A0A8W8L1N3_MAGGI
MILFPGVNVAQTSISSTEHAPPVLLQLMEIIVPPDAQINILERTVVSNVIVGLMKSVTLYMAVLELQLRWENKQQNALWLQRRRQCLPLVVAILRTPQPKQVTYSTSKKLYSNKT